jgi:hypothetical protein
VDFESPFDEIVVFELPDEEAAERLWLRLSPARMAWLQTRDDTHCVAVVLRAGSSDLALLLRELEAWLVERGVPQVRFELDGQRYSLCGPPAPSTDTTD